MCSGPGRRRTGAAAAAKDVLRSQWRDAIRRRLPYRQDPRGGNLSAHGKATGEAFWPASRLLMDHLVRDCELLKGDAPRRVVELGCGLGLAGLVAATMLGATKGSEVVLSA